MKEETKAQIEWELENGLYYLSHPDDGATNWWKDGDGNYKFMPDMGLDHLKACIKKLENDRNRIITYRNDDLQGVILPLLDAKLEQLKNAFKDKAKL